MQFESIEQLAELVRDSPALTVHSMGAGSDDAVEVNLSGFNRVLDYPAADMTITVESGITVSELQSTLASNKQHLPIDVPNPQSTTIGDAVAWNLSGSRRFGYGTFRDYLIGVSAIDGSGRRFKSGGRVVKNVAGYDLCKLLIGSHGTLAILTQLTFKVLPQPVATVGVSFAFDDFSAIDAVLEQGATSATRPVAIDIVSDGATHQLVYVFDGGESEVVWQQSQIGGEISAAVEPWSTSQVAAHLASSSELHTCAPGRFVAGLRPSALCRFLQQAGSENVVAHAANGIAAGKTNALHALRSMADGLGGWCRSNTPDSSPAFDDRAGQLMSKVRATFDPERKLNQHI